jgi:hypothetical protein
MRGLGDTKAYVAVGNHDTFPSNIIKADPIFGEEITSWLQDWKQFVPDSGQQSTLMKYGYYSSDLEYKNGTKFNNTKVISLNLNFCYLYNWATATMFQDHGDQLNWLIKELLDLEKNQGKAIILSHLPTIEDHCNRQYGKRLSAIFDRFESTIRWSMYSHVHTELFNV